MIVFLRSLLRLVFVVLATLVLAFAAVTCGLVFQFWPTSLNDSELQVNPQMIQNLREFKSEKKFTKDAAFQYPGVADEWVRNTDQTKINDLLEILIVRLPSHPRRSFVLRTFKDTLNHLPASDPVDQDCAIRYLERTLTIVGISDSGELLNVWRYGLPFGWNREFESVLPTSLQHRAMLRPT